MAVDLCPWLGSEQDRTVRHAEVAEEQVCYAQRPPAEVDLAHQSRYCLIEQHRTCTYYREPGLGLAALTPVSSDKVEDEVDSPPRRFPVLQAFFWIATLVVAAVLLYAFGSTILGATTPSVPAAVSAVSPSPTATASPTATPLPTAMASPTFGFLEPTATATPYPGGAVYSLEPEAGAVGWVASNEAWGNHLGDSFLYAGVFDGVTYHGIFQFDLSAVPRGASIHSAVLEITGLDDRRLGTSGVWEVRILAREADADWSRQTYQAVHNAAIQWTLPPALSVDNLVVGESNAFALSGEQLRDLEQRLLNEHYTVSFRTDGPLAGENSLYAWDTGYGPASQGRLPRLLLNVGPPPQTPIPTGSPPPTDTPTPSVTPTPTDTPEWFVIASTPTPENVVTAAAIAVRETAWATSTGTATATPEFVATPTPLYIVVTNTPTPENVVTAVYQRAVSTAFVILTGTPTPPPQPLITATSMPLPTATPAVIWLDMNPVTPTPTTTPMPTLPPPPPVLEGKILFLSDRTGKEEVYVLDPAEGRLGLVTARWPYDQARQAEFMSPDGRSFAYVQNDSRGVPQIYIYSREYAVSRQVSFNTGMSYDPAWSPRGGQLAFVSTENRNDDIYVMDIDGQGQVRLTFNNWEWDKHPSWSPDGTRIVFWSNQGSGRKQLWIMNADGTGQRQLLHSPYNDWDPIWVK